MCLPGLHTHGPPRFSPALTPPPPVPPRWWLGLEGHHSAARAELPGCAAGTRTKNPGPAHAPERLLKTGEQTPMRLGSGLTRGHAWLPASHLPHRLPAHSLGLPAETLCSTCSQETIRSESSKSLTRTFWPHFWEKHLEALKSNMHGWVLRGAAGALTGLCNVGTFAALHSQPGRGHVSPGGQRNGRQRPTVHGDPNLSQHPPAGGVIPDLEYQKRVVTRTEARRKVMRVVPKETEA